MSLTKLLQGGGDGAVNAQGPPDDAGIGGRQPPGGGDWKEKCCKYKINIVFPVPRSSLAAFCNACILKGA